jgi:hypothetical protein
VGWGWMCCLCKYWKLSSSYIRIFADFQCSRNFFPDIVLKNILSQVMGLIGRVALLLLKIKTSTVEQEIYNQKSSYETHFLSWPR